MPKLTHPRGTSVSYKIGETYFTGGLLFIENGEIYIKESGKFANIISAIGAAIGGIIGFILNWGNPTNLPGRASAFPIVAAATAGLLLGLAIGIFADKRLGTTGKVVFRAKLAEISKVEESIHMGKPTTVIVTGVAKCEIAVKLTAELRAVFEDC
ncbi:MAG: hypothetical protein FWG64_12065 [Firmicutes bacterium]|nr:hypothetical protein [Bacillota bacterium]